MWLSDTLSWSYHVHHMTSRASPRLYYIRQLKRSGLTREALLVYYKTMIRSILEYACPVWHAGLTSGESHLLEQTQNEHSRLATRIYHISNLSNQLIWNCCVFDVRD